jgi:haloalkane dehalogenase
MQFVVLDEDFLLNRRRAMELREAVLEDGRPISLFVFSSIKAISQYTVKEIMEMGIDGFWIGYEGARSGYAKQQGRPASEIFREFRENGITILASMVIGFDYQDEEVVQEELDGLLDLKPTLGQYLIYGPTPGTPFYEKVMAENRLREDLSSDPEKYYKMCDGFSAMVKHPTLSGAAIERMQRSCFKEDFERLGPSIYRALETWFLGYQKHKNSGAHFLRKKSERFAHEIRKAYPIFLAGAFLGPNRKIRAWIRNLEEKIHRELGPPNLNERFQSLLALAGALWTGFKLKFNLFQHPRLTRHAYKAPQMGLLVQHWWEAQLPLTIPSEE